MRKRSQRNRVQLAVDQRRALEELWFLYGNHGKKHTDGGHRFIQVLLERGEDAREMYSPGAELAERVDAILAAGKATR